MLKYSSLLAQKYRFFAFQAKSGLKLANTLMSRIFSAT